MIIYIVTLFNPNQLTENKVNLTISISGSSKDDGIIEL